MGVLTFALFVPQGCVVPAFEIIKLVISRKGLRPPFSVPNRDGRGSCFRHRHLEASYMAFGQPPSIKRVGAIAISCALSFRL